jgi:autotransporter-associated beta strand protein
MLATSSFFFPYLTMTGGVVLLSGSVVSSPNGAFISGGSLSNTAGIFFPRSGTIIITNVAKVVTVGLASETSTSYGTVRFDGGTTEITGNTFATGNNSMPNGTRSASIIQSDGMVSMTNTEGLVVGNSMPAGQNAGSQYSYTIYGGTLNLEKLTIGKSAVLSPVNLLFLMSGGTLNLGSGGIVTNASSAVLNTIRLSGGMIGAQKDWSSSANMVLTNAPGTGMVTFRAAHTNGVAHDIALSGILSGNGRLTKTGGGALLLNGMNTYTGTTTVTSGTLGGTGSIAGTTTVASNAFVTAASTNTVGTLTMTNLVMQEGAGLVWNYGTATRDVIAVSGKLTLATNAVVNVSAAEGATFSQLPAISVLATYGSKDGATALDGWKVTGLPASFGSRVQLDVPNKQVLLLTNRGTMISIM